MRLRYKKVILIIMICTMGIGAITLSIIPNHGSREVVNQVTPSLSPEAITQAPSATQSVQALTITPMLTPTTAPLPVYALEEEGYPKITELFNEFFKAKLACNVKKLKTMFTNPDGMPSKSELKKEVQFINDYEKVKCYVKKGYLEGTYIVFVYYEIKYMNIKTPAPAMTQFYLVTEEDQSLKIYSDEFDEATWNYYNDRTQDKDVQNLSKSTDKKLQKALKKDEMLKVFWENLNKVKSNKQ